MKSNNSVKESKEIKNSKESVEALLALDSQVDLAVANAPIYLLLKRVYQYMKWSREAKERDEKEKQFTIGA
jgi:hypothetical protein